MEQRLDIVPLPDKTYEVAKAQTTLFQLTEQLTQPEACFEERLGIVAQLQNMSSLALEHQTVEVGYEQCEVALHYDNYSCSSVSKSWV